MESEDQSSLSGGRSCHDKCGNMILIDNRNNIRELSPEQLVTANS